MKVTIWTIVPNHYQAGMFAELRRLGVDLRVNYYGRVTDERVAMGWPRVTELPKGERYVDSGAPVLDAEWKQNIHVVPGCGERFLRTLALRLAAARVDWVHWSEPARSGIRWYAGYPLKRCYANLINRTALGALAIGLNACRDFLKWGVRTEKIALLTYSNPVFSPPGVDEECVAFRRTRRAFIFTGALSHRKGTDLLLRAFARLPKAAANWVLILVGPDLTGGGFKEQAKALGIGDRTLFRGPVEASLIGTTLNCAEVFVLPSRFDGWGVSLNEAASMGLALIATANCGAAWHLIEPGRNGNRVAANCVDSLTAAMAAYVACPGLTQKHGNESIVISREYSAERNAARFVEAIETWKALRTYSHARRH